MTGHIPTHITFISRKSETIENEWEDGTTMNSFEARPTFVAMSEASKETGLSWAQGYSSNKRGITVTEAENKPFTSLRIISYEKRNEGGGAFKAIADGKWYVDLRTDTLLDILVNHSVKGGEVQGAEFVWARVGSHAKIVRVGSDLHERLSELTSLKDVKPPKAGDLVPGDVYESKSGEQAIFLGLASTIEMKHSGSTSYSDIYRLYPQYHTIQLRRVPKVQCWFRIYSWDDSLTPEKAIKDWGPYSVDLKKSTSYRKKVKTIKVPADWMERMSRAASEHITELKGQYDKGEARPCDLAGLCSSVHVAPVGEQAPLHPEYKAFESFLA